MKRGSGAIERHDLANGSTKNMRPFLPFAMLLLSIIIMSLHAAGGIVLLRTGLGGYSLHNPLAYVLIGVSLVVAVFKLKHMMGFMRRKEKSEGAGNVRKG
jgi:hypothetical protein